MVEQEDGRNKRQCFSRCCSLSLWQENFTETFCAVISVLLKVCWAALIIQWSMQECRCMSWAEMEIVTCLLWVFNWRFFGLYSFVPVHFRSGKQSTVSLAQLCLLKIDLSPWQVICCRRQRLRPFEEIPGKEWVAYISLFYVFFLLYASGKGCGKEFGPLDIYACTVKLREFCIAQTFKSTKVGWKVLPPAK
jgi:hypothetical protein